MKLVGGPRERLEAPHVQLLRVRVVGLQAGRCEAMRRRPLSDWGLYGMIVLVAIFLIVAAVRLRFLP